MGIYKMTRALVLQAILVYLASSAIFGKRVWEPITIFSYENKVLNRQSQILEIAFNFELSEFYEFKNTQFEWKLDNITLPNVQEVVKTLNGTIEGVKWQKEDKSVDVCPWWYTKLPKENTEFPMSLNKFAVECCPLSYYPKIDDEKFSYGSRMLVYDYDSSFHDGTYKLKFLSDGKLIHEDEMEVENLNQEN